jgi:N-acetylglucosamine kinase-like BadF-type ATPase
MASEQGISSGESLSSESLSSEPLILGLDGGGTATTVWLAPLADPQRVVGRGKAGPANARTAGLDVAATSVLAAVERAFEAAGIPRRPVARACLAMAGADREEDRRRLLAWAQRAGFATRVRIVNDALPVLYAANREGLGVALIAGTGSLCLGRDRSHRIVRAGGWGYLLGDEGSAYWLAIQALQAVARAADGRGPATELSARALDHFGCNQPSELILKVYDPEMDRPRLARFAETVFELAKRADPIAEAIVDAAAEQLLQMVCTVIGQLRLDETLPTLAVTGGVLLNQPELVERLRASLNPVCPTPSSEQRSASPEQRSASPEHRCGQWSVVRVTDPVAGALRMAACDG